MNDQDWAASSIPSKRSGLSRGGYNHWVEDDPTSDGAFSSAGAFGFYPWVTADKKMWGVLAREDKSSGNGDGDGAGPGYDSAACGLKMRAAWNTGKAQ